MARPAMIGVLMILASIMMMIAGFTGRWRAFVAAVAPGFSHMLSTTARPKTAVQ